ncbi:MAG: biotin/lipoyl-containing protein [Bacillota bacterium]
MRRFKVKVNNEVFEVEVEEVGKTEQVRSVRPSAPAPAQIVAVPSLAPRVTPVAPAAPAAAKSAPSGAQAAPAGGEDVVRAPIPGVVSEIKVAAGKGVRKGEVLLLLEAMKMANEILAPYDATVLEVPVHQGASVQTGDVLVKLQH